MLQRKLIQRPTFIQIYLDMDGNLVTLSWKSDVTMLYNAKSGYKNIIIQYHTNV